MTANISMDFEPFYYSSEFDNSGFATVDVPFGGNWFIQLLASDGTSDASMNEMNQVEDNRVIIDELHQETVEIRVPASSPPDSKR
jgi:hypothetical protein